MIRCYVTDRHQGDLLAHAARAVADGVDMIQVREKDLAAQRSAGSGMPGTRRSPPEPQPKFSSMAVWISRWPRELMAFTFPETDCRLRGCVRMCAPWVFPVIPSKKRSKRSATAWTTSSSVRYSKLPARRPSELMHCDASCRAFEFRFWQSAESMTKTPPQSLKPAPRESPPSACFSVNELNLWKRRKLPS